LVLAVHGPWIFECCHLRQAVKKPLLWRLKHRAALRRTWLNMYPSSVKETQAYQRLTPPTVYIYWEYGYMEFIEDMSEWSSSSSRLWYVHVQIHPDVFLMKSCSRQESVLHTNQMQSCRSNDPQPLEYVQKLMQYFMMYLCQASRIGLRYIHSLYSILLDKLSKARPRQDWISLQPGKMHIPSDARWRPTSETFELSVPEISNERDRLSDLTTQCRRASHEQGHPQGRLLTICCATFEGKKITCQDPQPAPSLHICFSAEHTQNSCTSRLEFVCGSTLHSGIPEERRGYWYKATSRDGKTLVVAAPFLLDMLCNRDAFLMKVLLAQKDIKARLRWIYCLTRDTVLLVSKEPNWYVLRALGEGPREDWEIQPRLEQWPRATCETYQMSSATPAVSWNMNWSRRWSIQAQMSIVVY
jgi:hypothetical protein